MKHLSTIFIIMVCVSCTAIDGTQTPEPVQTFVHITPTLISTATKAPSQTATLATPEATNVVPSSTLKATETPEPTQSIIEVTPLGGTQENITADYWQGFPDGTMYTTWGLLNVRSCPSTDCEILDRYAVGKIVEVFAMFNIFMSSDKWLCLEYLETVDKETHCNKAIAYDYQGTQRGEIVWP